ncbi:hypothetical protein [Micromonospora robiginosa]|uniref:Uncharacterized protein n=1 Tax=Micromonospora robiginosa TaxID=2749844 RepID=A0AAF0SUF6_9ACTN|nr:hypothetical protein [Micromonospora ferruginea]WMF04539.1 hypothetical protein H1D33_30195 [Micromonospora ferruginea]
MGGRRSRTGSRSGQQIQAAEWEAAKRRILDLAGSGQPQSVPPAPTDGTFATSSAAPALPRRRFVPYEDYLLAIARTLVRRHRPAWSWRKWRWVCRCGADLPCRVRHRVPIGRSQWLPGERR